MKRGREEELIVDFGITAAQSAEFLKSYSFAAFRRFRPGDFSGPKAHGSQIKKMDRVRSLARR